MQTRRASIKETGEELSQAEWERFDAAVAEVKSERAKVAARAKQTTEDEPERPTVPRQG